MVGDEPGEMGEMLPYMKLGSTEGVQKITTQGLHTCMLFFGGGVKCWGENRFGELGQESNSINLPSALDATLPFVDVGEGRWAIDVTTGRWHSCVLLDNNSLKCWGDNRFGQLGREDKIQIGSNIGEMGDNLASIALGTQKQPMVITAGLASTRVLFADGTIKNWGDNIFGGLGLGDTSNRGDEPNEMGEDLPFVDLGAKRCE